MCCGIAKISLSTCRLSVRDQFKPAHLHSRKALYETRDGIRIMTGYGMLRFEVQRWKERHSERRAGADAFRPMSAIPSIVLQKSFCTDDQKFCGLQARLSGKDVMDLIASR